MAKKDKEEIKDEDFGAGIEDFDLDPGEEVGAELTESEKRKIELEAKREVAKALKLEKMKEYKAAQKKKEQTKAMFSQGKDEEGDDITEVTLDLASHPKWIMLDGKMYHSGKKYKVKKAVAQVLLDQMDRGWRQEAARLGEKSEFVQARKQLILRGGARG